MIRMKKKVYIAGPLFNQHERQYLEDMANHLESNGFECFLPHRDLKGVDESELKTTEMSQETKDKISPLFIFINIPAPPTLPKIF